MKNHFGLALALTLGLTVSACGEHDHDHEDNNHAHNANNENPEAEICEHMEEGPFQAVTAAEDATGTLSNIAIPHTRVDIALAGEGADRGGVVSFEAPEAGEYTFSLSQNVEFVITDSNAVTVAAETSTGAATLCPMAVLASHTFDLEIGTYTITLGPADLEAIGVVFETGEHVHDH